MTFIYLIILSLPLYLVRFSVLGFGTNILDISLFSFIFFLITKNFYLKKSGLKEQVSSVYCNYKKILLPVAFILIGLAASTFKSGDVSMSVGIIKSWFVLPILMFAGSISIVDSDDKKRGILKVWFFGGYLVALASIFYYFSGFITFDGRLSAFFPSPNNLSMFLIPSFIIGVWLILQENNKPLEFFYKITGLALMGFVIFATKSLGGFAALLLSFIFLMADFLKLKGNKKYLILLSAVFLICATVYLFYIHDFSGRSSLMSRIIIWKSAIKILRDNYVLGIGPGMFQEKYLSYQKYFTPYLEWAVPHPHNIFLAFWLQSGLIGVAGFLWLIAVFLKDIWKNKNDKIVVLCGALMIYFLAHGMIDVTYWRNDLAVMFWMTVLLSLDNKKQIIRRK